MRVRIPSGPRFDFRSAGSVGAKSRDQLPTKVTLFSNRRMSPGESLRSGGGKFLSGSDLDSKNSNSRRGGGNVESAPLFFALSKELANPRFCFWGFAGSVISTALDR